VSAVATFEGDAALDLSALVVGDALPLAVRAALHLLTPHTAHHIKRVIRK
jgi:hypothetical protein